MFTCCVPAYLAPCLPGCCHPLSSQKRYNRTDDPMLTLPHLQSMPTRSASCTLLKARAGVASFFAALTFLFAGVLAFAFNAAWMRRDTMRDGAAAAQVWRLLQQVAVVDMRWLFSCLCMPGRGVSPASLHAPLACDRVPCMAGMLGHGHAGRCGDRVNEAGKRQPSYPAFPPALLCRSPSSSWRWPPSTTSPPTWQAAGCCAARTSESRGAAAGLEREWRCWVQEQLYCNARDCASSRGEWRETCSGSSMHVAPAHAPLLGCCNGQHIPPRCCGSYRHRVVQHHGIVQDCCELPTAFLPLAPASQERGSEPGCVQGLPSVQSGAVAGLVLCRAHRAARLPHPGRAGEGCLLVCRCCAVLLCAKRLTEFNWRRCAWQYAGCRDIDPACKYAYRPCMPHRNLHPSPSFHSTPCRRGNGSRCAATARPTRSKSTASSSCCRRGRRGRCAAPTSC